MNYLLVKHKIADFEKWLAVFKSHEEIQEEAGFYDLQIMRNAFEPNIVTVFFKVRDIEKAKSFTSSQKASAAAVDSGVIGTPEGLWLKEL